MNERVAVRRARFVKVVDAALAGTAAVPVPLCALCNTLTAFCQSELLTYTRAFCIHLFAKRKRVVVSRLTSPLLSLRVYQVLHHFSDVKSENYVQ